MSGEWEKREEMREKVDQVVREGRRGVLQQEYLIWQRFPSHFMIIRNIIKNIIQDHDDLHQEK